MSLKIFPGVWVLPGGQIEEGEALAEAALREVEEEVGIRFENREHVLHRIELFALYESVYPLHGAATHHHLVFYFKLDLSAAEGRRIDLANALRRASHAHEVDLALFVRASLVPAIRSDTPTTPQHAVQLKSAVPCVRVASDGKGRVRCKHSTIVLEQLADTGGNERLSIGTQISVRRWADNQLKKAQTKTKSKL